MKKKPVLKFSETTPPVNEISQEVVSEGKVVQIARKSYELGAETMLRFVAKDLNEEGIVELNKSYYREKFKNLTK